MSRLLCLAVLLGLPGEGPAAPLFPGGVLDSTGRTAYLASEAGLDAIDLARGELLWQSRDAHQPLLVAGDRLYALALGTENRLSVVAFDLVNKAERVFRTDVTDFPRWVATRPAAGGGQAFRCDWRRERNVLFLDWQADARPQAGPRKYAIGQLQIDLDTGRVRPAAVALRGPRPGEAVPRQLEKKSIRWQGRAGGLLLAAVLEDLPTRERRQRLVLRGWDVRTGKEGPARELIRGSRPVLLGDLDGRHLWVRDAALESAPWEVVSALDGHLVARARFVPGTQAGTMIGPRAYCLTAGAARIDPDGSLRRGRVLYALDLRADKVAWSRALGSPTMAEEASRGR